jgi:hypothetical protein
MRDGATWRMGDGVGRLPWPIGIAASATHSAPESRLRRTPPPAARRHGGANFAFWVGTTGFIHYYLFAGPWVSETRFLINIPRPTADP